MPEQQIMFGLLNTVRVIKRQPLLTLPSYNCCMTSVEQHQQQLLHYITVAFYSRDILSLSSHNYSYN